MYIDRYIEKSIRKKLIPGKVVVLIGARRVGKTVLIRKIMSEYNEESLFLTGDDLTTHSILENRTLENYKRLLGSTRFLIIDEAQEISDIGKKLKLMIDHIEGLKILISGSSAFEINNQIGEPLVGRKYTFHLFPLAQLELSATENLIETTGRLEERLIYGGYPELTQIKDISDKEDYLRDMIHSYLLKDILAFEGIKKRDIIISLLQKIAFRNGHEISIQGLGNELGISKNTVDRYLDLFKKVFILYDVRGFSQNRDNEITKMKKWFFMDNGIRNALINNFQPLNMRNDVGQLWESYLHSERRKINRYKNRAVETYFWRTHTQQEIDRIEVKDGSINAYEFKWKSKITKVPTQFSSAYPDARFEVVNQESYLDFIL